MAQMAVPQPQMSAMSPEILRQIFTHYHSHFPRCAAALVCSLWNYCGDWNSAAAQWVSKSCMFEGSADMCHAVGAFFRQTKSVPSSSATMSLIDYDGATPDPSNPYDCLNTTHYQRSVCAMVTGSATAFVMIADYVGMSGGEDISASLQLFEANTDRTSLLLTVEGGTILDHELIIHNAPYTTMLKSRLGFPASWSVRTTLGVLATCTLFHDKQNEVRRFHLESISVGLEENWDEFATSNSNRIEFETDVWADEIFGSRFDDVHFPVDEITKFKSALNGIWDVVGSKNAANRTRKCAAKCGKCGKRKCGV